MASLNLYNTHPTLKQVQIKDPNFWKSKIQNQTKLKNDQSILNSHTQMESIGIPPDLQTLPLVLKACARLKAIEKGKKIHSNIQNTQLVQDIRIRTALIDFYCKCGYLEEARNLFEETANRDIVSLNAMISGYVSNSKCGEAIWLFMRMQRENISLKPSSVTLVSLLSACGKLSEFRLGQEIHCYCLRNGFFDLGPHLGTALIGFYSNSNVRVSRFVFDSMTMKNIVSWNSMISGYFNAGDNSKALRLFSRLLVEGIKPGSVTVLVAVQACIDFEYLELGKQIHQLAIKLGFSSDLFIVSALINMYGKNGNLKDSCQLFESISTRDVAVWNSMLSSYKDYGFHEEVFSLFSRMRSEAVKENSTTVSIMLLTCAESASDKGKSLHAHIIKNGMVMDSSLRNALLSFYVKLNCLESAQRNFYEIKDPDIVAWNTLILALARNKSMAQLLKLLEQMEKSNIKPNSFTVVSVLAVCEDKFSLNLGRSIHDYVIRNGLEFNSTLCTALTDMYISCGDEKTAKHLFRSCPDRDLVSWNALITSYIENNRPDEALLVFHEMLEEMEPNSITIMNVLSSCARLSNLPQTRCLHAYALRREFSLCSSCISLGNALLTAYARCGNMGNAEKVFRSLSRRDVISWNAMISGYGIHGFADKALHAFSEMQEIGLTPNSVTFVSALSACSHVGLIEEGLKHFSSMIRDFRIEPEVVHYACMVDLLARGGRLYEAKEFIDSMPIKPDASVWRAMLGACRDHSETNLAKIAFGKLVELEPMNVGNYILLSNIYAASGLWEDVRKLRNEVKMKGFKKDPGNSCIVIRSQVHSFTAGDKSHPQSKKIYKKLSCLMDLIKEKSGYVPDTSWVLQDLKDEQKKDENLTSHSEKLAIAFGLLNMSKGTHILITKNLRVCGDCHTFSKHVSKCVGREIILRDTTRFHHFVNGVCSCKDYW